MIVRARNRGRSAFAVGEADVLRPRSPAPGAAGAWQLHAGRCRPARGARARSRRIAFSARTRPSLRVRRALMPWRIQTSSWASFLSNSALACASASRRSSRRAGTCRSRRTSRTAGRGRSRRCGWPARRRKARSWVTNSTLPANRSRNSFEPGDGVDVEVVGRLVQQQHVRLGDQRLRQQHAALHAAGQRGELGSSGSPGASAPGSTRWSRSQPCAASMRDCTSAERIHVAVSPIVEQVVVARRAACRARPGRGDHVEHACRRRPCGTSCASPAMREPNVRAPRRRRAGSRRRSAAAGWTCRRRCGRRCRRARRGSIDEVDVFEQQRAADAEVDVLELQEHPGILPRAGPRLRVRACGRICRWTIGRKGCGSAEWPISARATSSRRRRPSRPCW